VKWEGAQFLTLTYPDDWPERWEEWKAHLKRLFDLLRHKHPGVSAVWKLEYQKRGAPHFHLIVFGGEGVHRWWWSVAWWWACGKVSYDHLQAGTNVKTIDNGAGRE
jgi:hypothetical protein